MLLCCLIAEEKTRRRGRRPDRRAPVVARGVRSSHRFLSLCATAVSSPDFNSEDFKSRVSNTISNLYVKFKKVCEITRIIKRASESSPLPSCARKLLGLETALCYVYV